ncbi:MAG: VWA domain-containing protein [Oscillospiraceae bacterium]|nr:VWA domain-containing protein [Oscillospiraceae bacterium]
MKRAKRIWAAVLAAVLTLTLTMATSFAEAVDISTSTARHYNVMLVVDGSGSLTMTNGTDLNGYRYDAVQLFLGLLTDSGNYAGAIVFDDSDPMPLNTELRPISGSVAKTELYNQIVSAKAGGDTDIGSALLAAVEKLTTMQQANGLPSVVVLMSDGITDLPSASAEALQASYANEEAGIAAAVAANIPVYTVLLNGNNGVSTEEMETIADGTGGICIEVTSAEDLAGAYQAFYELIYNTEVVNSGGGSFDDEGKMVTTIEVPGFGVEEINIIAQSSSGIDSITATDPDGNQWTEEDMEVFTASTYQLSKIADPEGGTWTFEITGTPNAAVEISLVYNSNLGVQLVSDDDSQTYESGDTAEVEVYILDGGNVVTDSDSYDPSYVSLTMTIEADPNDTRTVSVTVEDGCYEAEIDLPEVETASSYVLTATLNVAGMTAESSALTLSVNPITENLAPEIVQSAENLELEDSGDGYAYFDLNEYFTDPEGEPLTYEIVSNGTYTGDEVVLDGSTLGVRVTVLSGGISVRASDGVNYSDSLTMTFAGNSAPVLSEAVEGNSITHTVYIQVFGGKTDTIDVSQWFSDSDGDAMTYSIQDCDYDYDTDGTITLDGDQMTITTSGFKKSNLILRATDSDGAYVDLTVHFKVVNVRFWTATTIAIVIAIVAAILIALAVIAMNRRFKGYICIRSATAGTFDPGGQNGGFRTPYPSFRGKKLLNSVSNVQYGNLDGKSKITVVSTKKIRFSSSKAFYLDGSTTPVKRVDISLGSSVSIFPDQEMGSKGITISTEEDTPFNGGGGFAGGSGGGFIGGNGGNAGGGNAGGGFVGGGTSGSNKRTKSKKGKQAPTPPPTNVPTGGGTGGYDW